MGFLLLITGEYLKVDHREPGSSSALGL